METQQPTNLKPLRQFWIVLGLLGLFFNGQTLYFTVLNTSGENLGFLGMYLFYLLLPAWVVYFMVIIFVWNGRKIYLVPKWFITIAAGSFLFTLCLYVYEAKTEFITERNSREEIIFQEGVGKGEYKEYRHPGYSLVLTYPENWNLVTIRTPDYLGNYLGVRKEGEIIITEVDDARELPPYPKGPHLTIWEPSGSADNWESAKEEITTRNYWLTPQEEVISGKKFLIYKEPHFDYVHRENSAITEPDRVEVGKEVRYYTHHKGKVLLMEYSLSNAEKPQYEAVLEQIVRSIRFE